MQKAFPHGKAFLIRLWGWTRMRFVRSFHHTVGATISRPPVRERKRATDGRPYRCVRPFAQFCGTGALCNNAPQFQPSPVGEGTAEWRGMRCHAPSISVLRALIATGFVRILRFRRLMPLGRIPSLPAARSPWRQSQLHQPRALPGSRRYGLPARRNRRSAAVRRGRRRDHRSDRSARRA